MGDFLEGFENFIVIMRSIETDKINGVRILGAKKNLPLLFRGEENNG